MKYKPNAHWEHRQGYKEHKEHKEHARKRNRQIDKTQAYIDEA